MTNHKQYLLVKFHFIRPAVLDKLRFKNVFPAQFNFQKSALYIQYPLFQTHDGENADQLFENYKF